LDEHLYLYCIRVAVAFRSSAQTRRSSSAKVKL
jgi:hypothetical protein